MHYEEVLTFPAIVLELCGNMSSITNLSIHPKHLIAIERYYPKIQKLLIHRSKHEKKENGVWIVPLPKALEILGLPSISKSF